METVQSIKQRFSIIGNDTGLNRAIEKAIQVAPTDISVLVTGESGVGKESIPKIIHQLSHRKHGKYIAVNCGAIPEGTGLEADDDWQDWEPPVTSQGQDSSEATVAQVEESPDKVVDKTVKTSTGGLAAAVAAAKKTTEE